MHRVLIALCAVAVACGQSQSPAPVEPVKSVKPAGAGEPVEPVEPVAKPKPPTPEELMTQTLARALEIQETVAKLRELPFKKVVPAERQTRDEFAAVVNRELTKVLPPAKSAKLSAALFHAGFLATKMDIRDAVALFTTTQAAAYYDPESGKFYAVSLSSDLNWLEVMTAHELTHGLQDQHFDLRAYYGEEPKVEYTEDQLNARRFVVEGEASFVMFLHLFATRTKSMKIQALAAQATMALQVSSKMNWKQMIAASKQQAKTIDGVDKEQLEAMGKIPPFVLVPSLESYMGGGVAIAEVYRAGGWKAVSDLYANPPDSTEQVLHPQKLINRDRPSTVELPRFKRAVGKPLINETMGELGWRVYLETWDVPDAAKAAAGWDGDRLAVYKTKRGLVALGAVTFDSENDATEFEAAFQASVMKRFPKAAAGEVIKRSDGGSVALKRRKATVFFADSADSRVTSEALGHLIRRTKIVVVK